MSSSLPSSARKQCSILNYDRQHSNTANVSVLTARERVQTCRDGGYGGLLVFSGLLVLGGLLVLCWSNRQAETVGQVSHAPLFLFQSLAKVLLFQSLAEVDAVVLLVLCAYRLGVSRAGARQVDISEQ